VQTLVNGSSGRNCKQRKESYDYNQRLQPVRIQLGKSPGNPSEQFCLV
jgi:hypothetical protein